MPQIARGTCYVLFAYDIAPQIDLERCERQVRAEAQRQTIARRRGLEYFEYRPAPLRITVDAPPVAIGRHVTQAAVDLLLYDFGAATLTYAIPIEGPLAALSALSSELYVDDALRSASRQQLDSLLALLKEVGQFKVADVAEDYVIFHVEEFEPALTPDDLVTGLAGQTAQILRAETEALAEQEVNDATSVRIAFGKSDLTVIDWNAALLYGRQVEDMRTVIEFANVQLLEMRFLDHKLDEALEESWGLVSQRRRWPSLRSYRPDVQRVARLQVDGAILFERVSNALKVFGEEYLSRVYGLTAKRLQLAAWDASAIRKLGTLDSIYSKLTDEAAAWRLEALEWIIVLLIAVSIVLSLVP
jgi:hypothetical protein